MFKLQRNGKASSIPAGMAISSLFSIITTMIICAVIAYLLDQEKISWEETGYIIMIELLITSFCTAKIAANAIKRQVFLVSVMSGILYWGLLLCITGLFFGGKYSAVPETALLILAGSVTGALLSISKSSRTTRRTRKYR